MYKVARDSMKPTPKPGAESVPGMAGSQNDDQNEIEFNPTEELTDIDLSKDDSDGEIILSASHSKTDPEKGLQAELVDDNAMEERIMNRIMNVAVVADVVDDKSPGKVRPDEPHESPKNRKKLWIILAIVGVLVLAGAGAGIAIALSGSDDESKDPATEPPLPLRADDCFATDDGSIICYASGVPSAALITLFTGCPDTDEARVAECETCLVFLADSVFDIDGNTPVCNGCILCGTSDSVAYDCTNISPEEECAFKDCSGECGKGDPPATTEESQADECFQDENPTSSIGHFCNKVDVPTNAFVTQFQDCPDGSGLNVFECNKCIVVVEDRLSQVDGDSEVCNGCLVCGDTVAFDCSNVAPDQACAVTTCDGTCVG